MARGRVAKSATFGVKWASDESFCPSTVLMLLSRLHLPPPRKCILRHPYQVLLLPLLHLQFATLPSRKSHHKSRYPNDCGRDHLLWKCNLVYVRLGPQTVYGCSRGWDYLHRGKNLKEGYQRVLLLNNLTWYFVLPLPLRGNVCFWLQISFHFLIYCFGSVLGLTGGFFYLVSLQRFNRDICFDSSSFLFPEEREVRYGGTG